MKYVGRAVLLLAVLGGLIGLLWALGHRSEPRRATLYYLDPGAMYLVPVETALRLPTASASALQGVLDALTRQTPPGLMGPLPSGSAAVVQELHDGHAAVALRLAGPAPGSGIEQLMAGAVVRSAGSLGVQEVALSLQDLHGVPLSSEHLDLAEPLSPTDPSMENLYLEGDSQGLAVVIYYRLPRAPYLVPLHVPLPTNRASEPLAGSFAMWLETPPASLKGVLASAHDPRCDLRWNGVEGGVAQILWKNAPQATPSALALRSLALTLTEGDRIRAIQLRREGPPLAGKSGPFDLGRPIARPEAINPLEPSGAAS